MNIKEKLQKEYPLADFVADYPKTFLKMFKRELDKQAASLRMKVTPFAGFVVTCDDDDSEIYCKTLGECEAYIDVCKLTKSEFEAKYGFMTDGEIAE